METTAMVLKLPRHLFHQQQQTVLLTTVHRLALTLPVEPILPAGPTLLVAPTRRELLQATALQQRGLTLRQLRFTQWTLLLQRLPLRVFLLVLTNCIW